MEKKIVAHVLCGMQKVNGLFSIKWFNWTENSFDLSFCYENMPRNGMYACAFENVFVWFFFWNFDPGILMPRYYIANT